MNKKKIIIGTIIGLLIVTLISICFIRDNRYDFKIYFFKAGKADAMVISKKNQYMMIDTGEESLCDDIIKYFQTNHITKLEYLIITHFDKDHVGSAACVLNHFEVGKVFQSNVSKDSEYYTDYLKELDDKKITPMTVSGNYDLLLGDVKITINGPNKVYKDKESNNSSLIVSIMNDQNKFLFMGDSQNARIKDFLNENQDTYDFLKVPYHGHYLKRLDYLVESTRVKTAVITSSHKNPEDAETLSILDKYDVTYYLTRNGSISVLSNGESIKVKQ